MIYKFAEKNIALGLLFPVIHNNKLQLSGNKRNWRSFLCNSLLTEREIESLAKVRKHFTLNGVQPKNFADRVALKFGYVPESAITEKLHYATDVAKRLDEHREVCEYLLERTNIASVASWHAYHLLLQDEYLEGLFELAYGEKPNPGSREYPHYRVRPRPDGINSLSIKSF